MSPLTMHVGGFICIKLSFFFLNGNSLELICNDGQRLVRLHVLTGWGVGVVSSFRKCVNMQRQIALELIFIGNFKGKIHT